MPPYLREGAHPCGGVRVHIDCRLATAKTHLTVDVNIGDPNTPAPQKIQLPRLLDQADTTDLLGYPLHMVHAEKRVTAIQRGSPWFIRRFSARFMFPKMNILSYKVSTERGHSQSGSRELR